MVMPKFSETLAYPSKWIEPAGLVLGAKRIIQGLNYIHKAGFVHMDVKGANIFLDQSGDFYLGDFGSCVRVNTRIISYTAMFYWKRFKLKETPAEDAKSAPIPPDNAEFRYDWQMLAVALVIQCLATLNQHQELIPADSEWKSLLTKKDNIDRVSEEKILAAIEKVTHLPLKTLLLQLMKHTDSQLNIE